MTAAQTSCSSKELKILGDYWTLMIIQSLEYGKKRFCELERSMPDTNPTTLTNRLKKLEKLKFLARKEAAVDKLSVSYELTDKGTAIIPILKEIQRFAKSYL